MDLTDVEQPAAQDVVANANEVNIPDVQQAAVDAERKRIKNVHEAIRGQQKAVETIFKYCTNENFRQMAMQVLKVQDWNRAPEAVQSHLTQLTKRYHNVDVSIPEEVALAAVGVTAVAASVDAGVAVDEVSGNVAEPDKEDDDFESLAAYAELIEAEP